MMRLRALSSPAARPRATTRLSRRSFLWPAICKRSFHRSGNTLGIEAVFGTKLFLRALLDKPVGNADAATPRAALLLQGFKHCRAETALQNVLLDCYERLNGFGKGLQHATSRGLIKRAFTTAQEMPSCCSIPAASRAGWTVLPMANTAASVPSLSTCAFPSGKLCSSVSRGTPAPAPRG